MQPLVYHQAAEREFLEAVQWYEAERPGRGLRLDAVVQVAERLIRDHTHSGSPYLHGTRQLVLPRFPYSLIYSLWVQYPGAFAFAEPSAVAKPMADRTADRCSGLDGM